MKGKVLFFVLYVFTIVSDQASKLFIDSRFTLNESRPLLDNILTLHYIRNSGIAFGMSFGSPVVMIIMTGAVIIVLLYLFLQGKIGAASKLGKTAMTLILGGATGNMIDRIRIREVIDFIEMGIGRYRWPVYNLADIYVTCGMILFLYHYFFVASTHFDSKVDDAH